MPIITDSIFQREASGMAPNTMGKANSFVRGIADYIRSFWAIFRKMVSEFRACGLTITRDVEFARALSGLNLTEDRRVMVLPTMSAESPTLTKFPVRLREVAPAPAHYYDEPNQFIYQEDEGASIANSETACTTVTTSKGWNMPVLERSALVPTRQLATLPHSSKGKGNAGKAKSPGNY